MASYTIVFSPAIDAMLRGTAQRRGGTKSAIIRQAIVDYCEKDSRKAEKLPTEGIAAI